MDGFFACSSESDSVIFWLFQFDPLQNLMKRLFLLIFVCSLAVLFQLPATQAESNAGKLVLGIVSISSNEANNQRFIQAATKRLPRKAGKSP